MATIRRRIGERAARAQSLAILHSFLVDRRSAGVRLDAPAAGPGARPYSRLERYAAGDLVTHPAFGMGRVTRVDGKRVDIPFESGVKTLAHAAT